MGQRYGQCVVSVRIRSVRASHQEVAAGDHREFLSATKYLHRILRGVQLETTHPVIASAHEGAARSNADAGNQISVRRPISWVMLLAAESLTHTWRTWGSGKVACSVSVVLLLDPRVEYVGGNEGRKFTSRIACDRPTWPFCWTKCKKGRFSLAYIIRGHHSPLVPGAMLSIL